MSRGFGVIRIDDPRVVTFDSYPSMAGGYYFPRVGVHYGEAPTVGTSTVGSGYSGGGGVPVAPQNPSAPSPAASFPLQRSTDTPAPQETSNEGLSTPLLIALVVAAVVFLK
jgi:hypothetical protein